jgi:cell division protein FtsB
MFTNLTLLTLIIVLGVFLAVTYFELQKINKQVLEIQKQIHYLSNEVNKLKQQAKKKYYSNSNGKQVIQG